MKTRLLAFCCLVTLAGCTPGTKYEWGAYQPALLAYYKEPAEQKDFDKALDEAIVKGGKSHKVPPGLYAEAGYEALSHGDTQKAVDLFNQEKAAWPESGAFMDKAIANAGKAAPAKPAQTPTS